MNQTPGRSGEAQAWWRAFWGLISADACMVCGSGVEQGTLCAACRAAIEKCLGPICPGCALPRIVADHGELSRSACSGCHRRDHRFDAAVSLGTYEGPLRHLCLRLKNAREAWLAPRVVELLLATRRVELEQALEPLAAGTQAPLVTAVPLHWWRNMRRGYNQAEVLARALARRLGYDYVSALRRVRATPKLRQLSRTERTRRLRGAFGVRRRALRRLAGRTVILVDDILTTGATCNAAAATLKRVGARRVVSVVVARAKEPT